MTDFERTGAFAIIPALNEQETISQVVEAAFMARQVDGLVVVSDGSVDHTFDRALAVTEHFAGVKPAEVVEHPLNLGKAEALRTGVETAKEIGGRSIKHLVFLDADLSPISSRQTPGNSKLGHGLFCRFMQSTESDQEADDFATDLANHIDELLKPVVSGELVMNIAMLHRTALVDRLRLILNWGALSGNRALPLDLWERMLKEYGSDGLEIHGWETEAALNTFTRQQRDEHGNKLNRSIGKFVMPDVVNVGSRQKAGSLHGGLARMAKVQGQAIGGFLKFGLN